MAAAAAAATVATLPPPPTTTAVSNTPQSDQLLIDLIESSEEAAQLPQSLGQLSLGGGAPAGVQRGAPRPADEFDMLAQSRTDGNQ